MAWKIERRPDNEKDEWLSGYGTAAGIVGFWGIAALVMTKIFNGVKISKNDAKTTDEE